VPGTLRLPAAAARLPGLRRLALTGEQVILPPTPLVLGESAWGRSTVSSLQPVRDSHTGAAKAAHVDPALPSRGALSQRQ